MGTLDLSFDESAFSGRVPLFPLPSVVLLPGGLLPLHVFELRFREMVRDSLAGEGLIAMALLRPGYEADYAGQPDIEDHVCVGRIAVEQELEDGRWNMLLVGLRRARIVSEDRSRSYRLADVELVTDEELDEDQEEAHARWLHGCLRDVPPALQRDPGRLAIVVQMLADEVPAAMPLAAAADLAADALLLGVRDRMALLKAGRVSQRVALLAEVLRSRIVELEGLRRPNGAWPPRFSSN